jgi:hypothetical protein
MAITPEHDIEDLINESARLRDEILRTAARLEGYADSLQDVVQRLRDENQAHDDAQAQEDGDESE